VEAKSRFCRDFGMEHFPQTTRNYPPNHESISLKPRAVSLRPRVDFPQTTKTAYKWAERDLQGIREAVVGTQRGQGRYCQFVA
jgi:hypothetical protein